MLIAFIFTLKAIFFKNTDNIDVIFIKFLYIYIHLKTATSKMTTGEKINVMLAFRALTVQLFVNLFSVRRAYNESLVCRQ